MKQYTLVHPHNKASIKCTERYLLAWLSRGFEVEEITKKTQTIKRNDKK